MTVEEDSQNREPSEEATGYASNLPEEIREKYGLKSPIEGLEFERYTKTTKNGTKKNTIGFYREVKEDGVKGYLLILSKNKTIADVYNSDFIKKFENNPDYSFVHIINWNKNYFKP